MRIRDLRATVLFVPGLRDHVADHWQTLLAAELPGSRTVPPLAEDKLSRAARVAALDRSLAGIEGPVILAAHSAGCLTLAHWALAHRREGIAALLADWGARLAKVGAVGHLNPAAGFGPWPDGRALIAELDLTLAGVAGEAQA
jgi:predicted alpha/beta hydrolase family esterase